MKRAAGEPFPDVEATIRETGQRIRPRPEQHSTAAEAATCSRRLTLSIGDVITFESSGRNAVRMLGDRIVDAAHG